MKDDREIRSANNGNSSGNSSTHTSTSTDGHRNNGSVGSAGSAITSSGISNRGEDEWKNIHTMLNCISGK